MKLIVVEAPDAREVVLFSVSVEPLISAVPPTTRPEIVQPLGMLNLTIWLEMALERLFVIVTVNAHS